MGNQLTSTSTSTVNALTDRTSLNFNTSLPSARSASDMPRSTKSVTVHSLQELSIHKEIFNFRLKNRSFIANCYGFELADCQNKNITSNFSCKSNFIAIEIVFHFQQITYKFSDLYQLSIDKGLQLLAHCIQSFSILYDKFGYFLPQPRLIMKQGEQWKIWISQNIFVIRTKFTEKNKNHQFSKAKFLQKVVHLFNVLRDEQFPDFSYTAFVYGQKKPELMPNLELNQILQRIQGNFKSEKILNLPSKKSLRRVSLNSNQTVRKTQCKSFVSFDGRLNDATLSKFGNGKQSAQKFARKSLSLHKNFIQNTQQTCIQEKKSANFSKKYLFYNAQRQNNVTQMESSQQYMKKNNKKQNLFKRVDFNLIHQVNAGQNTVFKELIQNKHIKNRSSVSTPSNCTGWTKQMTPLKKFVVREQENVCNCSGKFRKKQRSLTVELSSHDNSHDEKQYLQPKKITQNSENNSQSDQNSSQQYYYKEAFVQSSFKIVDSDQNNQVQQPVQIIYKNLTSNTPSIAYKTKRCGQETMNYLKENLFNYSKGDHKRSLTDHTNPLDNKIKYCWSQQFDSAFFSNQSNRQYQVPSQVQICEQKEQQIRQRPVPQEKGKKVMIVEQSQKQRFSYKNQSGQVRQTSQSSSRKGDLSGQIFLCRQPIFKSQGGLKSLLTYKLDTLKSIKQIEVDITIDEEILNDLNKLYTKHRFAKSTKFTQ